MAERTASLIKKRPGDLGGRRGLESLAFVLVTGTLASGTLGTTADGKVGSVSWATASPVKP